MADIVWPLESWASPIRFYCGVESKVMIRTSTQNGTVQTRQLPGLRFRFRLEFSDNAESQEIQPKLEALLASIEGQAHRIIMPHLHKRRPRGTISGNPTCQGALARTRSIVINAGSGQTLLPRDMIGVTTTNGPQVLMVTNAVTVGSSITVYFVGPLRADVEAGTPLVINSPTIKLMNSEPFTMVGYSPQGNPGINLDLFEVYE